MRGDFTRVSFDRAKHFSRVLRQQGRVTVEADDNEQTAILLHYLRTLTRDLIGPFACPREQVGFVLSDDAGTLKLSAGHCYVDGFLVENEEPFAVEASLWKNTDGPYWLYLDVWEHHVTALDDDSIREKALGGPDTSSRAKVVWRVRANKINDPVPPPATAAAALKDKCSAPLDTLARGNQPAMAARVDPGRKDQDPCVTPPDSKYRGMENQLYRVEIQRGGKVGDAAPPTFKWSRDNGSVTTAWLGLTGSGVRVSRTRGFETGDWIEATDEKREMDGAAGGLARVTKIEGDVLSLEDTTGLPAWGALVKPRIRRWNQRRAEDADWIEGALLVKETPAAAPETKFVWIDLEDGVQVMFTEGGEYRSGDYWLIPARVATGSIEWPHSKPVPPQGVEHHYAPLGFVAFSSAGVQIAPCACVFEPVKTAKP